MTNPDPVLNLETGPPPSVYGYLDHEKTWINLMSQLEPPRVGYIIYETVMSAATFVTEHLKHAPGVYGLGVGIVTSPESDYRLASAGMTFDGFHIMFCLTTGAVYARLGVP